MPSASPKPSRAMTASAEHYLRAILELREEQGYARVVDIATRLGLTKGSVSLALGQLHDRGLIRFDNAHFPILTPSGRRIAMDLNGRYRIALGFLTDILGVAPERASAEACRWEHVMSHEVADRLLDFIRFGSEQPQLASRIAEFRGYHRSCSVGGSCATCAARGPVQSYCIEMQDPEAS